MMGCSGYVLEGGKGVEGQFEGSIIPCGETNALISGLN